MYKQNIENRKTRVDRLFNFERKVAVLNFMKITLNCKKYEVKDYLRN